MVVVVAMATLALLAFSALATVVDFRSGPLGLLVVLEEQLVLVGGVVLIAATALLRSRVLVAATGAFVAMALLLFGSESISIPAPERTADMTVMTWNLERGARSPMDTVAALQVSTADVVALQELEPAQAAAIEADAILRAAFPYRQLAPDDGYLGVGLLSRYPLLGATRFQEPAGISASVETPVGAVTVINAHPLPGRISTVTTLRIPIGFESSIRDRDLARLRDRVEGAVARGERVLLIGDFNTSPTDPAYEDLAAGLRDVHVEVGEGPGWT